MSILSIPARCATSRKDSMNPRSSNTPTDDHRRSTTTISAGFIARELRETAKTRSI